MEKYRNIIDEGLANKKKITAILKEIGPVKDVAAKEIELVKANEKETNIFRRFYNFISKDLTAVSKEDDADKKRIKEEKRLEREKAKQERRGR